MKEKVTYGIVGGMGSYATADAFKRVLDASGAKNDQEFPHLIIDNNSSIPSRIEASKNEVVEDELVKEINQSIARLEGAGCRRILIACNTAHLFFDKYESRKAELINMVAEGISDIREGNLLVLGTEALIEGGLFEKHLPERKVIYPSEERRKKVDQAILLLKTDDREKAISMIEDVLKMEQPKNVVLACTELSEIRKDIRTEKNIIDILDIGIKKLLG